MSHSFLFIEMGLKVHRDGFKPANSLQWYVECGSLCEIGANVNLLVQLKESLQVLLQDYILK